MPPIRRSRSIPLAIREYPDASLGDDEMGQPTWVHGHKEYEVERIEGHSIDARARFWFHIKWLGWSAQHNTWEPIRHLKHCQTLVREYVAQNVPRNLWHRIGIPMELNPQ